MDETKKARRIGEPLLVAPSDIISNLFLEDLERIWELKMWITRVWNPLFEFPYTLQILQKKVRYYVTWGYK